MTKKIDDLFDELDTKVEEIEIAHTVEELEKQVLRLRKTLEQYNITEEAHLTNIEYICQKTLQDLAKIARNEGLTQDDAKIFDIVHKNLRQARGNFDKKEVPGKSKSEAELLRIVKGNKK